MSHTAEATLVFLMGVASLNGDSYRSPTKEPIFDFRSDLLPDLFRCNLMDRSKSFDVGTEPLD
jgi:hypothetical protein